jgi:hypothetical protein
MDKKQQLADSLEALEGMDFADYFDKYVALSKRSFMVKDIGISPREYQHWKAQMILPPFEKEEEEGGKREWVRLDFVQYIWLRMVKTLRNFGYPFKHIEKTKDFLFSTSGFGTSINIPKDNPDVVSHLMDFIAKDGLTNDMRSLVYGLIQSPAFLANASKLFSKNRYVLEVIIFEAITYKNMEIGLGFYEDGKCLEINMNLFFAFDKWDPMVSRGDVINHMLRRPHIFLSITNYLMEFIVEEKGERELSMAMLSEDETHLLREIRNKEYKNITINYDKGRDTRIIKTEKEKKIKQSEFDDTIRKVIFAPMSKTTITPTSSGDLIINVVKAKKMNK